ncbi:MAG: TM2 domain-containing protein [Spirochaetales bacterium]|nr:TM2 domain-containing protein [Spirochaetales bacterium]
MLDTSIAYLLWVIGFFFTPCPGLHRLYMKKFNLGTVFRFIPGIGHLLALVDLALIPSQIREINLDTKYRHVLSGGSPRAATVYPAPEKKKDTIERVILRVAKQNKGIITPGQVALEGDYEIDAAKSALDILARKGFSELQVKPSGVVVYTFPEFMDDTADNKFVDF